MKKQLLALTLTIMSIGMFGQSAVWSPYSIQTDTAWGVRYLSVVDTNVVWATTYDRNYTTRTSNRFTRTVDGATFVAGIFLPDTNYYAVSNISAVNDTVAAICAYSKDASRNGIIMKTIDGGVNWTLNCDTSFMFTG